MDTIIKEETTKQLEIKLYKKDKPNRIGIQYGVSFDFNNGKRQFGGSCPFKTLEEAEGCYKRFKREFA